VSVRVRVSVSIFVCVCVYVSRINQTHVTQMYSSTVLSKEPYILSKEPYVISKELNTQRNTTQKRKKSSTSTSICITDVSNGSFA